MGLPVGEVVHLGEHVPGDKVNVAGPDLFTSRARWDLSIPARV